jgi:hypothetical protein
VDALPSELPEDTQLSHDYLSVAVEFSDGRDLTYTWSRELPVETSYWCPLPGWSDREHHLVVRSGLEVRARRGGKRPYADHAGAWVMPARIAWPIAVSLFQRLRAGLFADLELAGRPRDALSRALATCGRRARITGEIRAARRTRASSRSPLGSQAKATPRQPPSHSGRTR